MSFSFTLVTPNRKLFDEPVASVSVPTPDGEITILPHHLSLTAVVSSGIMHFVHLDGVVEEIAVSGGCIHVAPSGDVTVLTDTAERGFELDAATIEAAKERARQVMRETISKDDASFAAAAAALERELARSRLVTRHGHHPRRPTVARDAISHDKNAQ